MSTFYFECGPNISFLRRTSLGIKYLSIRKILNIYISKILRQKNQEARIVQRSLDH